VTTRKVVNPELNIRFPSKPSFSSLPYVSVFAPGGSRIILSPKSFCLSVPSSVSAADPLLKINFHKPPQSCHKVILTLTNHHKALQTSKKNRDTNLVHKPSPRSAAVTAAGTSGVPPRLHQIQIQKAKMENLCYLRLLLLKSSQSGRLRKPTEGIFLHDLLCKSLNRILKCKMNPSFPCLPSVQIINKEIPRDALSPNHSALGSPAG
jgi:hypothetical protein